MKSTTSFNTEEIDLYTVNFKYICAHFSLKNSHFKGILTP